MAGAGGGVSDSVRDELLGPDPADDQTPRTPAAAPAIPAAPRRTMRAAQCGGCGHNLAGVPREVTAKGKPLLDCPECGWIETFEFDAALLARRREKLARLRGWRRFVRILITLAVIIAAVIYLIGRP